MQIILFNNGYYIYNKKWSTMQVRTDPKIIKFINDGCFYGAYGELTRYGAYYSSNSLNMGLASISQDMKFFAIVPKYEDVYICENCRIACNIINCHQCGNFFNFEECSPEKVGEEIIYSNVALRDRNEWYSTDKNRFNTKIIIFIENGGPYQFSANGPRLSSGDGCIHIRENYPICQIRIIRFMTSISNNDHCYYIDIYFRRMIKEWKVKRLQRMHIKAFILACSKRKDIFNLCTIYKIVVFLYPNFTFQSMKRLCA
jgi:hypothetical protein